jgi:hypothetical protein
MRKFVTVFLTCALLLVSSGFATSQNRFKHGTVLKPSRDARRAQAALTNSASKSRMGHHPGSAEADQKNGLHQNLERRDTKVMLRK